VSAGQVLEFVGDMGVEVSVLSGLEKVGLAAQCQLQCNGHHIDKLFALVLVCNWIVGLVRFDGDHEGPQIIMFPAFAQALVGLVLGAPHRRLQTAVANGRIIGE
jgi:hypothetical protein